MQRGPLDVRYSVRRSGVSNTSTRVTVFNDHPSQSVAERDLERLVRALVEHEGVDRASISVVLCDHKTHQRLNSDFLGRDHSTDVLAFPLTEDGDLEGEVYVDLDTARERHTEFGESFETEVARYVVHGTLHLLGYDDHDPERRSEMKATEDQYVELFRSGRF